MLLPRLTRLHKHLTDLPPLVKSQLAPDLHSIVQVARKVCISNIWVKSHREVLHRHGALDQHWCGGHQLISMLTQLVLLGSHLPQQGEGLKPLGTKTTFNEK